jgi:ribosomal protein L30/L7E
MMFEGIAIGVGSTLLAAIIIAMSATIARLWHSPKRLDRIDAVIPALCRAVLVLLRLHKEGEKVNGELVESIREMTNITTNQTVSQKAAK